MREKMGDFMCGYILGILITLVVLAVIPITMDYYVDGKLRDRQAMPGYYRLCESITLRYATKEPNHAEEK